MNPSKTAHVDPSVRGFALVVTLSLMILLTIIAVGLLTLSAISLRSSSQGEAAASARANARLALSMAIGELQREMGPDSRISAPYDAGTTATGGQPHWTAVYDAWKQNEDANTPESPNSRTPKFRNWLASGANQATGGPAGTGEVVVLVGRRSLGTTAKPEDEIKVPMHAVTRGTQQGRIAWWTSDESAKAKVNAGPDASPAATSLADAQSPPHIGHKAIQELIAFEWKPGQRSIATSNASINLAAELGPRGIGNVNHDITVHSAGVLSDVRAGRLKRDLTNLLSRPISELENKPLYLADGRMNRFEISDVGAVSNAANIAANASGADRWGINLEELHLFHQLHREIDWSTGQPRLVNKNTKEAMVQDRFFIYRKPTMEAVSVMLCFIASPEASGSTYRLDATLDAMVATSNPNDIPIVWPAGVHLRMKMEGFPYRPKWNIRKANNSLRYSHTVAAINRPFFQSAIRGGFTLEPGEAAVFGASTTDTKSRSVNLTRGYVPRGGVFINEAEWSTDGVYQPAIDGLRATGLLPSDKISFSMIPAGKNNGATPSGWISCHADLRNASGSTTDIRISTHRLAGGNNSLLTTAPINLYMPSSIKPRQTLQLQEFMGKALPVMMVTTMSNVEKSRTDFQPPNAFPSRPYLIHEPAIATMLVSTKTPQETDLTMQNSQLVVIGETMDYEYGSDRTMPAGGNLYHGGAREVQSGGSLKVIKRRIPLSAPLSLGAFENAIACGLVQRYTQGRALNGSANSLPAMAKSIGNSWSNPFMPSGTIYNGTYHDPSWMANTALWDSWFLCGIVNAGPNSAWEADNRSPRQQFRELAENTALVRNKRLLYSPRKSIEATLDELFDGDSFKPSAINKLPGYLLVDGAFNVNSTSEQAWKAFLSSVRDQELIVSGGKQKFGHPFGTLGYAQDSSSTNDWSGLRDLSEPEIQKLAAAMVVEVKARGPFLSMADFVNRRPNSPDAAHKALGALQAAIDKSGLNDRYKDTGRTLGTADVPILDGKDTLNDEPVPVRAIGSAGFLSQGALLSSLGSQITVRGDTFVIRTYGDARDASGKITAKAWCEAVVQRLPDYVDPSNAPETSDNLTTANSTFGRKFEIVSFRWLNSEEI